ncbi:MAG TPA: protein-methionine-sulfoxide reductase catalytic subunit MsrP [Terriglobales bacterium]|nr:protein-methionine-sulfoxide reductase catalytic subunit MsrP [Terriglobales bacterium]
MVYGPAEVFGWSALAGAALVGEQFWSPSQVFATDKIPNLQKSPFSTNEKQTPYKDITNYNNYYEFSPDKYEPASLAQKFKTRPWTVTIDGAVKKKQKLDVDSIIKLAAAEERIYRHRCVEGWSIVVPWIGFSLSTLINKCEPLPKAKFVEFTTVYDTTQMPGQQTSILHWPYTEGLRMDEAMHPLTLLCFGLYGETLPNQNGAPLRIIVPWKYGFKSVKAIVKISFVENQPPTAWNDANPREYGFYSNVNPHVDHPRWSQAKERRLGEFIKRETLMFNGYDQVASMYSGMDLKKNF